MAAAQAAFDQLGVRGKVYVNLFHIAAELSEEEDEQKVKVFRSRDFIFIENLLYLNIIYFYEDDLNRFNGVVYMSRGIEGRTAVAKFITDFPRLQVKFVNW